MFKKHLIKELSHHLGTYVSENLISEFMIKRHIYNPDRMSNKYKEKFLNEFLDKVVSKLMTKEHLETLRQEFTSRLLSNTKSDSSRIEGINIHEIVNDPLGFLEIILGRYCSEILLTDNEPDNIGERINLVKQILCEICGQFYNSKQMKKLLDDFYNYIKGKYRTTEPINYQYYIRPEFEESLQKAKLIYFEKILKNEDYRLAKPRISEPQQLISIADHDIDKDMIKYLTLHFGRENSKEILTELKYELKLYRLQHANQKHREEFFNMLLDRHFGNISSFGKLAVIRSRLARILRIRIPNA